VNTQLCLSADLPQLLRESLGSVRAAGHWRRWLSPQLSYGRHDGPSRSDARQAAVAILLWWENSTWHVPLTVRSQSLATHGGQVSFPGGAIEPDETSQETAHRELVEELFVGSTTQEIRVEWLGELEPLFVFVSNQLITPWLGRLVDPPTWRPQSAEVERVLSLPLIDLISCTQPDAMQVNRGSLAFTAPCLNLGDFPVWGSTGVLLGELRYRLEAAGP